MITNNEEFYTYMVNKGVPCTYIPKPPTNINFGDDLIIIFTNNYHALSICGNRFNEEKELEFEQEASELLNWLDCGNRVIMISNVNKFGTPYMRDNFELLQQRYDEHDIVKQVVHTKDIGELINPHRIQLRYKGVTPIKFDIVRTNNIIDPKYHWLVNGNVFQPKHQQVHYMNVLNASHDTETRRKLRHVVEYTVFSQLYKKLTERSEL